MKRRDFLKKLLEAPVGAAVAKSSDMAKLILGPEPESWDEARSKALAVLDAMLRREEDIWKTSASYKALNGFLQQWGEYIDMYELFDIDTSKPISYLDIARDQLASDLKDGHKDFRDLEEIMRKVEVAHGRYEDTVDMNLRQIEGYVEDCRIEVVEHHQKKKYEEDKRKCRSRPYARSIWDLVYERELSR